ncbi:CAP domain-containing protein [Flavobacterium sp. ASW18X]|uniref:CAP domain-containing protein n=1 Tax=Flavobacterium sp. ASW18X TaxID=2572595 RepID=UPI0010AE7C04|nr:CAP domain-containing protein [Flavobacterium sp. ASW18X]TKD65265.1 CAP domain-containing protein [Flavobacterium sp. ASW18X]
MKKFTPLLILCIVFFASCSAPISVEEEEALYTEETVGKSVNLMLSDNEEALFAMVNNHRVSVGLPELELNKAIYNLAKSHNEFMIKEDALSHTNFELRANEVAKLTKATSVSENVARKYNMLSDCLEGWLASPSHKNTIEGDFTHATLSIVQDAGGELYFTQIFYKL